MDKEAILMRRFLTPLRFVRNDTQTFTGVEEGGKLKLFIHSSTFLPDPLFGFSLIRKTKNAPDGAFFVL